MFSISRLKNEFEIYSLEYQVLKKVTKLSADFVLQLSFSGYKERPIDTYAKNSLILWQLKRAFGERHMFREYISIFRSSIINILKSCTANCLIKQNI